MSSKTFEQRLESTLNLKMEIKNDSLELNEFHKKLSQHCGDIFATIPLESDIDSITTINGKFARNMFINAMPFTASNSIFHKNKNFCKEFEKEIDGELGIILDDLAEFKLFNTRLGLDDAIQNMMEDGSTGDVLQKLNDRILRFGAMFLVFNDTKKCNDVFEEFKNDLTTDVFITREDGTKERITKEQEIEEISERPFIEDNNGEEFHV